MLVIGNRSSGSFQVLSETEFSIGYNGNDKVLTAMKLKIPAIPISNILLTSRCFSATVNWTIASIEPRTADMRISTKDPENATLDAVAEATAAANTKVTREYEMNCG